MLVLKKLLLMTFAFILFASCVNSNSLKPQDPIWGKQSCSHCGMILSEKRYASQRVISAGKSYYYDDINCALKHNLSDEEKKSTIFVRPFDGVEWVDAASVNYDEGLMTPMNSGFGPVKQGGKINFNDVQSRILKK